MIDYAKCASEISREEEGKFKTLEEIVKDEM